MNIITPKERARRDAANLRRKELTNQRKAAGLCRCGEPLERAGTARFYSQCVECRRKGNHATQQSYHIGRKGKRERPEPAMDRRLKDQRGVRRRHERDGFGRQAWWWTASAYVDGKQRVRRFSIDKYGDLGAFRLARKQRDEWDKLTLL